MADIRSIINDAASRYGVNPDAMVTLGHIETGGKFNANAFNKKSGASGIFQFIPSTWDQYGNGASPFDVNANTDAAARLMRDNAASLRKGLGREPSVGELYLAHQQGAKGALKLLSNPNAPATSIVGLKAVKWNGGKVTMSARQFANIWISKAEEINANYTGGEWSPQMRVDSTDYSNVNFGLPDRQKTIREQMDEDDGSDPDFFSLVAQAWENDSIVAGISNRYTGEADLNYRLSPDDIKRLSDGLDDRYINDFAKATSKEHADWIRREALAHQGREQNLQEAGLGMNMAARLVAGLGDPGTWIIGAMSGGVAVGVRGGLAARAVAGAATGAADGLLYETARGALKPGGTSADEMAMAGLMGAAFGGTMGAIGHGIDTRFGSDQTALAMGIANKVSSGGYQPNFKTQLKGSVGAAMHQSPDDLPFVIPESLEGLGDADVAKSAYTSIRRDPIGRLKGSKNPAARLLGSALGEDAVGNADFSVNRFGATEEMTMFSRKWKHEHTQSYNKHFDQWFKRQKEAGVDLNRGILDNREAHRKFGTEVGNAIRGVTPSSLVDPDVKAVASEYSRIMNEVIDLANNPAAREGGSMRPVEGGINKVHNYLPRNHDHASISHIVDTHGYDVFEQVIRGGIKKGFRQFLNKDIRPDLLERLTKGYARNVYRRANGLHDELFDPMSLDNTEKMAEILKRDFGLKQTDVDDIVTAMREGKEKSKGLEHAKHRVPIAEDFTYTTPSGQKIAFTDLLNNDAYAIVDRYIDKMSGRIALARIQLDNPTTGERWIDGLVNEKEINAAINAANEFGAEMHGAVPKADHDNLRWMFDRLLHKPVSEVHQTSAGQAIRTMKNFNFARVMSQSGLAQLIDAGQIVMHAGLKASFESIPELRRILRMPWQELEKKGVLEEIEAIWGSGTEAARARYNFPGRGYATDVVEQVSRGPNNTLDAAEFRSWQAARVVAENAPISMHNANEALQLASMKAMINRWGRDAVKRQGRGLTRVEKLRFAGAGLDEKIVARIDKQIRKHVTQEDGMLFGKKVTEINIAKWDDLEARAKFENAMFRLSRRMVQENDIGQMHMWQSSAIGGLMLQFRSFIGGAWTKQTLRGIHLASGGDMSVAAGFAVSTGIAGLIYTLQQNLRASTHPQGDAIRERMLTPDAIAAGAIGKTGFMSILPQTIDTSISLFGFDPIFSHTRSTGLSTGAIMGNPTADSIAGLHNAGQAIFKPILDGRDRSQKEYQQIMRMLPFQNMIGIQQGLNYLIPDDAPKRPPRQH